MLLVGLTWLVTVLGIVLGRAGLIPFDAALLLVAVGGALALVLTVQCVLGYRAKDTWDGDLIWAMPVAVLVAPALTWGAIAFPWTHDVATDLEAPPLFLHLEPKDAPGTPVFDESEKAKLKAQNPQLRSQTHTSDQMMVLTRMLIAAKELPGWQTTFYNFRGDRIEGTTRSPWLGLTSQVVIVTSRKNGKTVIDMRARSNVEGTDFGENARLLKRLQKQFGASWICKPGKAKAPTAAKKR